MDEKGLSALIAAGEGPTCEFKRNVNDEFGNELCAFAYARGGVILVGVDDSGRAVGLQNHNRLKSNIQSYARSVDPPVAVEVESVGAVLCVTVPEQRNKPYAFGGRFYRREGASCQKLTREEIRAFFHREDLVPLDQTPCRAFDPETDISRESWSLFAQRCGFGAGNDPIATLENLHLMAEGAMTHAGAWLLAEDITRFTLQASAICAVFRGAEKDHILDRKAFTGNLYAINEGIARYFHANLKTTLLRRGWERSEHLELPEGALREAVVNALAHRDYRSTAQVQIYIFRDRVEIVTPGGLPAGMQASDLGRKSLPRNPLLFNMLCRMGLVEQIGSGIRRMQLDCREAGVPEPEFEISEHWLTVIFRRSDSTDAPHVTPHVTPHVKRLLLAAHDTMSRMELMAALGLKDRVYFARTYLNPGLADGLIEMTDPAKPRSRLQTYRLTPLGAQMRLSLRDKDSTDAPHVTPHVTPHVKRLLLAAHDTMSRMELMAALGLKDRVYFARTYLNPGLADGLIEMTDPAKPRSRLQTYRLTPLGAQVRLSLLEAERDA